MKIHRAETVVRYHVSFLPHEAKVLDQHEVWSKVMHVRPARSYQANCQYHRGAEAALTRNQINDICDVLGVNGREFMASLPEMAAPSSADVSIGRGGMAS